MATMNPFAYTPPTEDVKFRTHEVRQAFFVFRDDILKVLESDRDPNALEKIFVNLCETLYSYCPSSGEMMNALRHLHLAHKCFLSAIFAGEYGSVGRYMTLCQDQLDYAEMCAETSLSDNHPRYFPPLPCKG